MSQYTYMLYCPMKTWKPEHKTNALWAMRMYAPEFNGELFPLLLLVALLEQLDDKDEIYF